MFDRVKDVNHPEEDLLSVYRDHGVVRRDGRDDNFNKAALDRSIYQLVHPGWLVVNRMKAWQGSVGISPFRGIVSGHYICFRPAHHENDRFLNWLLRSAPYTAEYAALSRGVRPNQVEIDNEWLRSLRIMLPPLEEQRRIADFLDAETARLDRLAVAMHKQDDLLKHRRLRVLDLLGDVGTQPKKARLGYLSLLVTSGSRGWSEYIADSGELFFRSANLHADRIQPKLANTAYVQIPESEATEGQRARIKRGDVLIGITGANAGWVCLADDAVANGYVSQHVCLVRPDSSRLNSRWLALLAASTSVQSELMRSQYGGTKTQLSLPDVRAIRVPVLPVERQAQLALSVERRIESLDRQRALRQRQLQLLTERRQALITAAVTGQFDVTTASGRNVTEGVAV
ncbi:restriction endonuclease subunit S [Streptomyces sp. NPDC127197]|uniref:restriction endonuclease subunit S n=1 Tax=Streptomyces sp. NPDC127197 TaxID=3345388 RepID=UPI00363EA0A3